VHTIAQCGATKETLGRPPTPTPDRSLHSTPLAKPPPNQPRASRDPNANALARCLPPPCDGVSPRGAITSSSARACEGRRLPQLKAWPRPTTVRRRTPVPRLHARLLRPLQRSMPRRRRSPVLDASRSPGHVATMQRGRADTVRPSPAIRARRARAARWWCSVISVFTETEPKKTDTEYPWYRGF
jgi:hypothetical protein